MAPLPILAGLATLATLGILSAMTSKASALPLTPNGLYTGPDWRNGEPLWPGIDVSVFQRSDLIDWSGAVEKDGVRWGMVRGSYGSSPDHEAPLHVSRMRDAGVLPGLYFFPTDATVEDMWKEVREQSRQCDIAPGDVAPAFDLEWFDSKGRMPANYETYLATVEELLRRSRDTFGAAWIYTSIGFWQQMGRPVNWLEWDWWRAQYAKVPPTDDPIPWTAWQKGLIKPAWNHTGNGLDYNLARFLPLVQKVSL